MDSIIPRTKMFVASFLRLTRIWNLLIIALAQYFTAAYLVDSETIRNPRLFLLSVSTMLIAAAGYIINDYYDVKIDFINKPDRVVVGRSITRRYALFLHGIFSGMGILIGIYLSLWIGAVNLFSVASLALLQHPQAQAIHWKLCRCHSDGLKHSRGGRSVFPAPQPDMDLCAFRVFHDAHPGNCQGYGRPEG